METTTPEPSSSDTTKPAAVLEDEGHKWALIVAPGDARPSIGSHLEMLRELDDDCVPVLLSADDGAQWSGLPEDERKAQLGSGASCLPEYRDYRREPNRPAPLRRLLLRKIADFRLHAETMLENREAPAQAATAYARTLVGELLAVWCDVAGERFSGTLADVKRHAELCQKTGLTRDALLLYFDLLAAEQRFRLRGDHDLSRSNDERSWLAARVSSFTRELHRLCLERLSTPSELERRRIVHIASWSSIAALLVTLSIWFYWTNRPFRAVPQSTIGKPGAILATYYNDIELKKPVTSRRVPLVYVNAYGSPLRGINADRFSIRFSGFVFFPKSGRTTLCIENDDGARVYLHEIRVIDDWHGHPRKQNCKRINVEKGWHPLRIDFFEHSGPAWLRLTVGPSPKQQQLVPASHLCCRQ